MSTPRQTTPVRELRITDPDICRIVSDEQARRGDATASKTAGKIVTEWAALNKLMDSAPTAQPSAQQNAGQSSSIRENSPSSSPVKGDQSVAARGRGVSRAKPLTRPGSTTLRKTG